MNRLTKSGHKSKRVAGKNAIVQKNCFIVSTQYWHAVEILFYFKRIFDKRLTNEGEGGMFFSVNLY